MAVIGKIRERSWILLSILALALLIFIIQSALDSPSNLMNKGGKDSVGKVNGNNISATKFSQEVSEYEEGLKLINPQIRIDDKLRSQINDEVWFNNIKTHILDDKLKSLGIDITVNELGEILWGENAHPLSRNFLMQLGAVNDQTGQIDATKARDFFKNIDKNDPDGSKNLRAIVSQIEKLVTDETIKLKYTNLVAKSFYVPNFFAKEVVNASRQASASVLAIPYSSLDDTKYKITDAEISKYIKENPAKFKQEASRTLDIMTFDVIPTTQDSINKKNKLEKLRSDYLAITDKAKDTAFIERNSIQGENLSYYSTSDFERAGRNIGTIFSLPSGTLTDIYISNGSYVFTKVIDRTVAPDSVRAAHILLSLGNGTDAEKTAANKKADSLIALLATGKARFGDVAFQNSADEGSKKKGGDLGYFPRNAMVKEFNDQVFFKGMQIGQISKVESQFGLHIILLIDVRNPQPVIKVADFAVPITPSNETDKTVYNNAVAFSQKNDTPEKFDKAIKTEKAYKNIIVVANTNDVMNIGPAREIVRWAFEQKETGILKFFSLQDKYAVAKLNKISEKGIATAADVKAEVTQLLINEKKAEEILGKLKGAKNSDLNTTASKFKDAIVDDSIRVTFTSGYTKFGNEPKLSGAIFGTKVGNISKPIQGEQGIYIAKTNSIEKESPNIKDAPIEMYQKQIQGSVINKLNYQEIINSLIDQADIKDKRYSFF